jgi:hypothetical protein
VTLAEVGDVDRFESGPSLARVLDEASQSYEMYESFAWNPDYEASKRLNEALNLLDLTGMVVGENMPTQFFTLTGQAKKHQAGKILARLGKPERNIIRHVAEQIKESLSDSPQ